MKTLTHFMVTPQHAGFLFVLITLMLPDIGAAATPRPSELVSEGELLVGRSAEDVTRTLACSSTWRTTPAKTKHGDAYVLYVCAASAYQLYVDEKGRVFAFGRPLVDEAVESDYFARLVAYVKLWEGERCEKLRGSMSSWIGRCQGGKIVALLARPPKTSDQKRRDIVLIWGEAEMLSKMLVSSSK